PCAVLDVPACLARAIPVRDSTTGRVLPVCRPWPPCDTSSVVAHRQCPAHNAWNPSQQVRPHRAPAAGGPSLPACDGRECLARAAVVQRLCAALSIPSVSTSVHQRSTDLSVRFGLTGLS